MPVLFIKSLLLYLIEMQGKKCEVFRYLHLLWILFDYHPFLVQATTSTVTLLYTFLFKHSVSEMLIWLRNWLYSLTLSEPTILHVTTTFNLYKRTFCHTASLFKNPRESHSLYFLALCLSSQSLPF